MEKGPGPVHSAIQMKPVLLAILFVCLFSSCSSFKTLNLSGKRPSDNESASTAKEAPKFIEKISITAPSSKVEQEVSSFPANQGSNFESKDKSSKASGEDINESGDVSKKLESVTDIELKYAILLNTEVEQLNNKALLKGVDEWYGTKYRMGGTSKKGIDCSAFVCAVFASVYGVVLPRMAKDQYKYTRRISTTKLEEGDLLFFNTRGGVSHVGIYLQNNKFIHASTTRGVTISDMFETYYLTRFIGAGRVENKQDPVANN